MNNFAWTISTKIHFGQGQIEKLGPEAAARGSRALLVYGGGSIKRTGIYDAACESLRSHGIQWTELSGVEPNPKIESVREGVRLCRESGAEMIIALGGGSTIDCAKAISGAAAYEGDPWDLVCGNARYTSFLPVLTVLTLAATGSEMDHIAVISNMETNDKIGTRHEGMRPAVSILDPTYTYTVPAYQTACGSADIFAHALENYLWHDCGAYLQDCFAESILKTCVKYAPIAMEQPDNYEARANLMWAGSHAINGLVSLGKDHSWIAHQIEHQLAAYYDCVTHGAGLAVVIPPYLEAILDQNTAARLRMLAVNVFGITPTGDDMADARAGIEAMRSFFAQLQLPRTLRETGIPDDSMFSLMAEKAHASMAKAKPYILLSPEQILDILYACK